MTATVDGRRHYRPSVKELKHLEPELGKEPIQWLVYDENSRLLEEGIEPGRRPGPPAS